MALAASLSSGLGFVPAFASSARVVQSPADAAKPGRRGLFNDMAMPRALGLFGRKGAGISMAQQKRSVGKKRGVARNRHHHR